MPLNEGTIQTTLGGCAIQSTRPSQSEIFYFKAVIVGTIFQFGRVCHQIYNNRKYFTTGNGRPIHTYEQREQSTITPTQSEIFSVIVDCSYVLAFQDQTPCRNRNSFKTKYLPKVKYSLLL